MMGKVALLFVVAMAAGANATACTITACTSTDGSTVAGGTGCYCGTDNVFVTAAQFCYKKSDNTGVAFTNKLCSGTGFTNGVADTSGGGICTCSNIAATPLTTATLKYCFIASNGKGFATAATAPTCAVTTGITASTPQCYCGTHATTDPVLVPAAGFCYKKTDLTGIAFTNKLCSGTGFTNGVADTSGGGVCTCSNIAATPLTTATLKYCFIATNGKGFATAATAPTCVDTAAGATATTPQCYCGTHATTDPVLVPAAGFCYVKTDLTGIAFTKKLCSGTGFTNGVADTSGGGICTCSNAAVTPLTTATLKYCFIGANGVGFATAATEPACSVTTGLTVASAQCKCGGTSTTTNAVVITTAQFCYEKATTNEGLIFTKKLCSGTGFTNGVADTSGGGLCTCSNVAVTPLTTATLKYCFIASNGKGFATAATAPTCAVTTAATASTPQCYCGTHATTDPVLVPAAGFCYKKTDLTGIAFTKKICGNTAGATTNGVTTADLCTCSTAAATPLSTTSAGFCFIKTTGVGAVTAAASSACAGTGADGSTATTSTTNCYCGTSQTLTTTGQFCYSGTAVAAGLVTAQCFLAATSGAATTGMSTITLLAVALLALRQ